MERLNIEAIAQAAFDVISENVCGVPYQDDKRLVDIGLTCATHSSYVLL